MVAESYDTKQSYINGSLAFPGDILLLKKDLWIFVEVYGADKFKLAIKNIPDMQFSFGRFIVNDREQVKSAEATYWIECPKYAHTTYQDGKIFLTVGKKFKRENLQLQEGRFVESLFDDNK